MRVKTGGDTGDSDPPPDQQKAGPAGGALWRRHLARGDVAGR